MICFSRRFLMVESQHISAIRYETRATYLIHYSKMGERVGQKASCVGKS